MTKVGLAQALETSGVDVAPKVQISGGGSGASGDGGANGGVMQALLTLLMAEKLDLAVTPEPREEETV